MVKKLCDQLYTDFSRETLPVNLNGLSAVAGAYLVSHFINEYSSEFGLLIVCADKESSEVFYRNLKTFLNSSKNKTLNFQCEQFTGWDASPYSGLTPSIKNRIKRIRTLYKLGNGNLSLIVTDIVSSLQRCLTSDSIHQRSAKFKAGDIISREELLEKLEDAGYLRTDPCEDTGTYAIRGSIVDFFTPLHARPVRMEFLGDEIERIRHFDPLTQMSAAEAAFEADLVPTKEWSNSGGFVLSAKSKIKHHCDEAGIGKRQRDEFIETLDAQGFSAQYDYCFPFFVPENSQSNLFDELKRDSTKKWRMVIVDPLSVETQLDLFFKSVFKDYACSKENSVVPAPDSVYIADKDFFSRLSGISSLILSPFEFNGISGDFNSNIEKIISLQKNRCAIGIYASTTSQRERIKFLLESKKIFPVLPAFFDPQETTRLQILEGQLSSGFQSDELKVALFADTELVGEKKGKATRPQKQDSPFEGLGAFVSSLEDLNEEDLVVHLRHGVGKYRGLTKLLIDHVPCDFLLIEYADKDKLYLPVYRLDQIQKYITGDGQGLFKLDKLGTSNFEKIKEKVKSGLQDIAQKLLALYARRAMRQGIDYTLTDDYTAFEAKFPYPETPDQLKAIEDTIHDMRSERIMDRLICGDVGYGKTEVAMRAAYIAATNSKQVALLVPTTVLALQHERSFRERFKDTAIRIDVVSRFKTPNQIKESLQSLEKGGTDIIIGTHRLLSRDVCPHDLGLLIVDEEQRFGVEHKEKLKELKINSDVLTLTATPIPRTLQLSLMGLRDISIINTAPIDRLAVRTFVAKYDEVLIAKAINQELLRGGQVFFIHNRVQNIDEMADKLRVLVPEAEIIVGHGQLSESELEKRMVDFYNKKYNVLVCSTIIESGLDIPTANTMIINRADKFGLAQLYQLRGRVGRSQLRAYCYLLLPEKGQVTPDAKKRLEVIQKFAELGSGFKIASHDLELRGGGDIIGKEQSGHIAAVGYELFMDLLNETIHQIRGEPVDDHFDPEIKIPHPALIPEEYVPDVHQRLSFYRKLSVSNTTEQTHSIELEMQDRYGKPPPEVINLLWLIRIKQILRKHFIKALITGKERISLEASARTNVSVERVLRLVASEPAHYRLTPDSKIVIFHHFKTGQELFDEVDKLFSKVAES